MNRTAAGGVVTKRVNIILAESDRAVVAQLDGAELGPNINRGSIANPTSILTKEHRIVIAQREGAGVVQLNRSDGVSNVTYSSIIVSP